MLGHLKAKLSSFSQPEDSSKNKTKLFFRCEKQGLLCLLWTLSQRDYAPFQIKEGMTEVLFLKGIMHRKLSYGGNVQIDFFLLFDTEFSIHSC